MMETIPRRLRQARDARGITQEALAREAGIATRSYQYYEAGERIPTHKTMKALADALGRTVEQLFD